MGTWIAARWASPLIKYGLIALALLGLVAGVLWYIDSVRRDGKKAGAAEVTTQVQTQTIVIQREIRRAEDNAPKSASGVSERMRAGSF
jgi:hypothetical protein